MKVNRIRALLTLVDKGKTEGISKSRLEWLNKNMKQLRKAVKDADAGKKPVGVPKIATGSSARTGKAPSKHSVSGTAKRSKVSEDTEATAAPAAARTLTGIEKKAQKILSKMGKVEFSPGDNGFVVQTTKASTTAVLRALVVDTLKKAKITVRVLKARALGENAEAVVRVM